MNFTNDTNGTMLSAMQSDPSSSTAILTIYMLISALGIVSNGLILATVMQWNHHPQHRSTIHNVILGSIPKRLVINQSFSDLLCCLVSLLVWSKSSNFTVYDNTFGTFLCRIWSTGYIYWSFFQVSVFNLILLTIERYLSIVRPIFHRKLTLNIVNSCILACWITSFLIELPSINEATRNGERCVQIRFSQVAFQLFGCLIFLTFLIAPVAVMLYCYARMLYTLHRRQMVINNNNVPNSSSSSSSNNDNNNSNSNNAPRQVAKRELTLTVLILGTSYVVLFSPNSFSFFLYTLNVIELPYDGWWSRFTVLCLTLYVAANPIVYLMRMKRMRREVVRLICRKTIAPRHTMNGGVSTAVEVE